MGADGLVVGERDSGTSYASTDTPMSIPDAAAAGATSTLYVGTSLTIETVSIDLEITHADMGELTVTLTSPSGTALVLYDGNDPGQADYDDNLGWSDELFEGDLYRFHDEDAAGVWLLNVVDGTSGNSGTLDSWTLRLNEGWEGDAFVGGGLTVQGATEHRDDVTLRGADLVVTDASGTESLRIGASGGTTLYRMARGCVTGTDLGSGSGSLLTLSATCSTQMCRTCGVSSCPYYFDCGGSCSRAAWDGAATCTNTSLGTILLY